MKTMKTLKFGDAIIQIVFAFLLMTAISGCALLSGSSTTDAKLADIRNLSYAAASLGTSEALLENPSWAARFDAAEAQLDQLVTQKIITGDLLRKIIAALPVNELKSPQARIAISTATTLFDSIAGTQVNIERAPYVLAAASGIRDGIKVALEHLVPGVPMIVLETALPAKFNETILEALGRDAERPAGFENIEALPQRFEVMSADIVKMKAFIAGHTGL